MTQRDYFLVAALQRLRAAYDVLGDARPYAVQLDLKRPCMSALKAVEGMIDELEKEVEKAMDEPWKPTGPR